MLLNVEKEKLVLEDVQFGVGTIVQSRGTMTQINGGVIPYDATKSINQELDGKATVSYVDIEVATREPLGGDNTSVFKALSGSAEDDVVTVNQLTALEEAVYSIVAVDALLLLKSDESNTMLLDGSTPDPEYSTATRQVPANKGYVIDTVLDIGAGDMAKAVYDQNASGIVDTTEGVGLPTHEMGVSPYNHIMRLSQAPLSDCNTINDIGIFLGTDPSNAPTGGVIGLEQFDAGGSKAQRAFSFTTNKWYDRVYDDGGSTWSVWNEWAIKADITNLQSQITSNDAELVDHEDRITTNTANISTNTANLVTNTANIATKLPKDGSEDMTGNLEAPSISIGGNYLSPYSHINKIINGDFAIWQRGTSGFTVNDYSADRMVTYGGIVGRDTANFPGFDYCLVVPTHSDPSIRQKIEGWSSNAGKTYTVRIWATDVIPNGYWYDTNGNPYEIGMIASDEVYNEWTRYKGTFTVPYTSVGTNDYLDIRVDFIQDKGSDTYVTGWQVQEGSVMTPFEHLPIGYKLNLCQRYYQTGALGVLAGDILGYMHFTFINSMRSTPSISLSSAFGQSAAGITISSENTTGFLTHCTETKGAVYTADAEL